MSSSHVISFVIIESIKYLSIYERDYTSIKYQTSLAIKSIMASLVNSIATPMLTSYYIKQNIYQKNGLADDIFMLGITNALVPPIMKILDVGYFISSFMKWFKDSPAKKLYMNQMELNNLKVNMEFEIGYEYIYVVNLYLFVCYFVSLQPIICVFALLGYFIMFWGQKWSLFNRMRRPVPGNDLINTAMNQIIFLGPLVYSLGSLTWSNFLQGGIPAKAIVPNLIAVGISAFMLIFPMTLVIESCISDKKEPEMKYEDSRIFLPTEYDRLNPATAEEGIKDYMKYVEQFG
jgi:hypothetical protein